MILQYLHQLGEIDGSFGALGVYAAFSGSVSKSALLTCVSCHTKNRLDMSMSADAEAITANVQEAGVSEGNLNCTGSGARLELEQVFSDYWSNTLQVSLILMEYTG